MWTIEEDQLSAVLDEGKFILSFYNYGKLTSLYMWQGQYVEVFYNLFTSEPERMHVASDSDMKKYLDRMELSF
jgi:hypothetical protein